MSRSGVLRGKPIDLIAYFYDAGGDLVDPTGLTVAVYPPGVDAKTAPDGSAWVYDVTLTSAGSGPYAVTGNFIQKIAIGQYQYIFTVPSESSLGAATDFWEGTVDLQDLDGFFSFVVVGGGSVGTAAELYDNNMLFITLDDSIADVDGNTLGSNQVFYFTTTYTPLYSSVRRIRLELGALVRDVPDDTINLAIFEASLEADALTFGLLNFVNASQQDYFIFARRQYVTCLAQVILLSALTGQNLGGIGGGRSKRLADLDVAYKGIGRFDDLLKRALDCLLKYQHTLTSVGELGPGTSLPPQMGIKGQDDPDRPVMTRGWFPSSDISGNPDDQMPAANTRAILSRQRRGKRYYVRNRWAGRFR